MSILALDLGTKTGWAMIDGPVRFGTWDLTPTRYDSQAMRFIRLEDRLRATFANTDIKLVVFEKVEFAKTTQAAQIWGGLFATMAAWCHKSGIEFEGVGVTVLKKFATGKGNAKKPDMIAACVERGWYVRDDNQADACWLLEYARKQRGLA